MKRNLFISFSIRKLLVLALIQFCILNINAEIKLPRLISNGMILQRDKPLTLWGWASAGETISVTFQEKNFRTKADKKGNWKITLPSYPAGGPYLMTINKTELQDILIGDVWLSSGQSNMELPISRTLDLYKKEVENAVNPNIRLFRVPMKYSFKQEENDLQGGEWKSVTPDNILDFSAVSYFFAKEIYDKYNVPVGIISTAIGGSPAEAWLSEDALRNYPNHLATLSLTANDAYVDSVRQTESAQAKQWQSQLSINDKGISLWNKDHLDISEWPSISLPGYWSDKGLGFINGSIWLRKEFEVDPSIAGQAAILRLGCIVDSDSAFVNGVFVGTTSYQYPPRIYNIPAGILRKGTNNITVRTVSNGGRGGFVEEKPYKIITDKGEIDLTGDWKYQRGAQAGPSPSQTFFQYKPAGLYNGMIAPVKNFAIKGFLWYQGESNTGNPKEYKTLFPDLISNWRSKWSDEKTPFIYAQLPNFMKAVKTPAESNWAQLREAQRHTLTIPETGMAVTIDLGEWNDIHPLNKKDVARRLFFEAQHIAYNDSSAIRSPQYQSMEIQENSIVLTFSSPGKGLYTNIDLKGFTIAGSDKKYVWAKASFLADNKVRIWSEQVANPVSVRYAWADNPDDANLKNKEGLPAAPFTTE